ncbi:Hypothetical predicted protein [Lecanosticta acicola]|uniref:NADH-ubiquinone oxidoreductase 17.8 kDa subunit n=1 Tax=Lecanosticta acicola TaxID=111012 RepID=A0AAI8Z3W4_9PEZI|nr:Hypothetical predicted protein [Lecanosticta acicola]
MQSATRTAARFRARRLRPQQLQRQSRRHAHDAHGGSAHDHHHDGPVNESFGKGFYITLAAIPVSLAIYKLSRQGTDEQPFFTRLIADTYNSYAIKWAERNDFHTKAVEQAAADRVLFLNESNQNVRHVDLRFPEQFNAGSPWNVPAGHGSADLSELIAKYEKEAYAENEKKLQQLKENKIPAEQPYQGFAKVTPAAKDS